MLLSVTLSTIQHKGKPYVLVLYSCLAASTAPRVAHASVLHTHGALQQLQPCLQPGCSMHHRTNANAKLTTCLAACRSGSSTQPSPMNHCCSWANLLLLAVRARPASTAGCTHTQPAIHTCTTSVIRTSQQLDGYMRHPTACNASALRCV
jgi:hypothetical protein